MGAAFNNLMEEETKESLANMVLDLMATANRGRTALGEVFVEKEKLRKQVEQLEVQLAACSVAATGWAKGSEQIDPTHYGYSVAFQDVLDLRAKYEGLLYKKTPETPDKRLEVNTCPPGWVWSLDGMTPEEIRAEFKKNQDQIQSLLGQVDTLTNALRDRVMKPTSPIQNEDGQTFYLFGLSLAKIHYIIHEYQSRGANLYDAKALMWESIKLASRVKELEETPATADKADLFLLVNILHGEVRQLKKSLKEAEEKAWQYDDLTK
jgi:hypothetical protein